MKPISDELLQKAAEAMLATPKTGLAAMTNEERREYDRERQARYRNRKRDGMKDGSVIPNESLTRDILADLAVVILATESEGSKTLIAGLQNYFKDRPGFPLQIIQKCRSGKLLPKIVKRQ
jgi:hypothetical protein